VTFVTLEIILLIFWSIFLRHLLMPSRHVDRIGSEGERTFKANLFEIVTLRIIWSNFLRAIGHIVNFSSIGGLVSFPTTGYYHATKYAVEGLSESLAQEVSPLGIKVLIVEPGPFRTDWAGRSVKQSKTRLPDYEQTAGKRRAETEARSGNQAGDPVRAAQAIIKVVEAKDATLRLLLGKPALDLAYKKLETQKANFDAWAETTRGADFPDAQQEKAI
jgi:short-subunit dehydrogenase